MIRRILLFRWLTILFMLLHSFADLPAARGSARSSPATPTAGHHVAFWPLDEPAGTAVAGDLTGNGHYGTLSAGVTAGAAGAPTGDGDTAMAFHGADQVTVASVAGLPSGAHPASLEAWMAMAGGGAANEGLVGYGNYGSTRQADLLRTNGWAGLFTSWWNDDLWANGSATLIGGWHLATATYDGHARRLYLDGAPFAADAPAGQPSVQLLNLALGQTGGGDYLTGSLANVAIYPYALTPAQVGRHYALGEHSPAPTPTTSVLQYSYDGAGRLNSIVYPDGGRENHSDYDPAGRVTHISLPDYTDYYLAYNGAGQRTEIAFPNGGKEYWAYDPAGRPHDTWWAGPGGTVPFTQTATLDAAGQRTVLQDTAGTTTYGYDGAGRLTAASYPDGSTEADGYDQLGDRTIITSTTVLSGTAVTTNSFDAAAQLTTSAVAGGGQPGTTTYSYDGNGNQTGSSSPAGTTTNTFNQQDQLTRVSGPATNETFVYDGQGDRLRAYDQSSSNYQLHTLVQDLRPGGMSGLLSDGAADYGYADFGVGAAPVARMDAGSSQGAYLAADLLGSVRLATNPADQVLGSGGYDAWGNARPTTADAAGQVLLAGLQASAPFGYAGQAYDAGPGTYSMRARQYDPAQGRFQSGDPQAPSQGYPVTLNPYQYAGDMPTGTTDPSGKNWTPPQNGAELNAEQAILSEIQRTIPYHPKGTGSEYPGPFSMHQVAFNVQVYTSASECLRHKASQVANVVDFTGGNQVWDIELDKPPVAKTDPAIDRYGYDWAYQTQHLTDRFYAQLEVGAYTLVQDMRLYGYSLGPGREMPRGTTFVLGDSSIQALNVPPIGIQDPGPSARTSVLQVPGGAIRWSYGGPGLILWQPTDAQPDHGICVYQQAVLCAVDLFLGNSLSGAQQCNAARSKDGCTGAYAWLWVNLFGAAGTGLGVVRAAGSFGRLGLDGLRAFAAAGGRIRVSEDATLAVGARVFPQAGADGVILERSQAQRFLDGISCAVSALPALCFPAGTRVATPKGERAIDRLRVGDLVLAEDPKTGKVEAERVTATIAHPASPLLALDLSDGSSIRVQPNHAFWVDGGPGLRRAGWLQAGQLRPGDRLRTAGGKAVTVVRVRWNVGSAPVYSLTVAKDHTFFVGAARVLVHNESPCTQVADSPLTNQGWSNVFQVGESFSERGRTYRRILAQDAGGRSVTREEILLEDGSGRWVLRGSEREANGYLLEAASRRWSDALIRDGTGLVRITRPYEKGRGFDETLIDFSAPGGPRIILVEVKNVTGYVPSSEFTAIGSNLAANIRDLTARLTENYAGYGLTQDQGNAALQALRGR